MVFFNNSYSQQLQSLFNNIPIHKIYVNTFIKEEWYVDKIKLEKNFPEIQLIVSNDAINLNEFSLLNLYFATIYS